MDPLRIHAYKIHAIKKHKRQQFVGTVLLYSLSALACTLFCSSPLWYPPFCATFNVLFFFSLPKIFSFFFTSKVLFVVGNLIVIFLVGQCKFFSSNSKPSRPSYTDTCYDKYKSKSPKPRVVPPQQAKKARGVAKCTSESRDEEYRLETRCNEDMVRYCRGEVRIVHEKQKEEGLQMDQEVILPAEELNRLADDFIARINRQRRLEAEFCMS
ncbi:hypothetical protein L2E82_16071 [Cichorium intybus]|uniref:Uncharacterized protein n=1 Tax=Cichorium intybus TaxID=13427 RepID=A0ACB9F5G9_CICIN|nr:hypothetical protein L2E82_16071 [Cichorium intybus]